MRVIAGIARSMPLKAAEGDNTRPTTDRIKETLFNMLQSDVAGCRFLDLYSGSGAIGIEALSRGAKEAVLVENARQAIAVIKDNLTFTKLSPKAVVMEQDVLSAINRLSGSGVFDIIFMDPPYDKLYEKDVLIFLRKSDLINKSSRIIVEASLDTDFSYASELGYEIIKEKEYKTNKHVFLKLIGE